jgi:hypothetical protein
VKNQEPQKDSHSVFAASGTEKIIYRMKPKVTGKKEAALAVPMNLFYAKLSFHAFFIQ